VGKTRLADESGSASMQRTRAWLRIAWCPLRMKKRGPYLHEKLSVYRLRTCDAGHPRCGGGCRPRQWCVNTTSMPDWGIRRGLVEGAGRVQQNAYASSLSLSVATSGSPSPLKSATILGTPANEIRYTATATAPTRSVPECTSGAIDCQQDCLASMLSARAGTLAPTLAELLRWPLRLRSQL